ncbi:MAG TPA: PrgI family protein [Patescibacteria group bacterium]|nr:PrgI family protein [Patescibacteria group bacterium]
MPDQFVVPQFIEVEDKILGSLSVRQFLILLVGCLLTAVLYKLLSFAFFLAAAIPLLAASGVLALLKVNGMPFHFFLLNLLQSMRRPARRVWNKEWTEEELRAALQETPHASAPTPFHKTAPAGTRLQELALVVNTGGVYRPEEETES